MSKVKELTKDAAVYGISSVLSRFITFLLVPFYTHVISPDDYGIVNTTYAYIAFLNIVFLYGMDSAYLKYASLKKENERDDVFSSPFLLVLFSSLIITALMLWGNNYVAQFMEAPADKTIITKYIALILFFDALSVIPFAQLRLIRKARRFALIRTINIIINVALNIILIRSYKMGVEAVFISNLAASVATLLMLLPDIMANLKFRIDAPVLKNMLKFGLPCLPAGLASIVVQVIDRPILQALTNKNIVGIYGASYKLGIFMMLFVSMFQYAWQPFFLNNAKEKNAKEIFARVLTWFVFAGGVVLVFLSLFIDLIVKFPVAHISLIGKAYWSGLPIIPIILLGYLFNGIYINFTAGIFIGEKTKYLPYITGAGAVVNVAVNYTLIPVWGMTGAALATLASYLIMAALLFFVTQRFYKINYEYGKLGGIFLAITIIATAFYSFDSLNIGCRAGLLLLYFILLIAFNVINKQEFISITAIFLRKKPAV
ncbi:MAG: polysaccharide biosynthesis C-terminal domain-containing protein [Ignavibacteria bacterium]